jgi:uncharacterized protein with HEPN domain
MDKILSTLTQIIDAGNKILLFTQDITEEEFADDELKQYAIQRLFEIMGEGCSRLPVDVLQECAEMPCKGLKDLRNILIHRYDVIDLIILWDTIKIELPGIISNVQNCMDKQKSKL